MRPDIVASELRDNETWNTCPICHRDWKSKRAIPGVIHRTKTCSDCNRDRFVPCEAGSSPE